MFGFMNIKIRVLKELGADPECREVEAGTTIEEILNEYRSHLPYRVYTARINSENVALTHKIESECDVTFCDIRDDVAFRSFQRGLTLILLKAVHEIWGNKAKVKIRNSVNRGLFTTILYEDPETQEQNEVLTDEEKRANARRKKNTHSGMRMPVDKDLRQIEKHMWKLVDANKPIKQVGDGIYKLEHFKGHLYGLMPPSTGCLFPFALEAMRGGVLLRYPHPSDPNRLAIYRRDVRVFDAYDEEQEFLDSLKLGKISDLNQRILAGDAPEIIHMAEDRHTTRIKDIAQYILGSEKKVVLLAGPSSSGKTTTAKRLIEALTEYGVKEPLYFGTDDYYIDRENAPKEKNGEYNLEGLDAIDVELFAKNIKELLSGKTADLPRYDFLEGKKVFGERKSKLKKDQIIIVEGIHALNKKFSASIEEDVKFKFYISPLTQLSIDDSNRIPSTDVRLLRRIIRDHRTRGNSVIETILMWPKVRAGETVNIFPYNNYADVVFNSTLVYELPVLKKYVMPLLEEVPADNPAYGTVKRLLHFLNFFNAIEDESPIPSDSVLREFIGGSRFGP
jgi:uridine kinase